MKFFAWTLSLIATVVTTVAFAGESNTPRTETISTCTSTDESKIASLKIQYSEADGFTVVAKHTDGKEFVSEGSCAVLGGYGPRLALDCSIVLPGRDTGYRVKVFSPEGKERFAWVTPWNQVGNFESLYFGCGK